MSRTPAARRAPGRPLWAASLALLAAIGPVSGDGNRAPSPMAGEYPPPRTAPQQPSARTQPQINADGYTSARVCGECHIDIYDSWKGSLHAFSLTDPIFDTAYMQAIKEGGEEARRLCLRWHAPLTMVNHDYELVEGVTREGVSCDFCHTVTAVNLDQPEAPYVVDPGPVKRSVIESASSPAHEVAYSELHSSSQFCGGCHNYVSSSGSAIMSTYDEWLRGPYAAEGIQCQSCHMVLTEGRVVDESVQAGGTRIHLHSLIHDTDQVRGALTVQIVAAERRAEHLVVDVVVENVGSGHMVPTGMPSREVVLSVTAEGTNRTRTAQRRFRKVVADERGRPLDHDYEASLRGARILNDTRIRPRERRAERFTFTVEATGTVKLSAEFTYHYAPMIQRTQPINIRMGRAERYIY